MKTCTKCGVAKDLSNFCRKPAGKYGVDSQCKTCKASVFRAWVSANLDRARAWRRSYRTANRVRLNDGVKARRATNLEAIRAYDRAKYAANPKVKISASRRHRLKSYGLAPGDYEAMLASQRGMCAICCTDTPKGQGGRFHVDHDHKTGKVRGLLCTGCNTGIGHLKDSLTIVQDAAEYLRRHSETP